MALTSGLFQPLPLMDALSLESGARIKGSNLKGELRLGSTTRRAQSSRMADLQALQATT